MTEEYETQPTVRRRNAITGKVPASRKEKIVFRRCAFCDFVRDIAELGDLESKDERVILFHLKQAHGLER